MPAFIVNENLIWADPSPIWWTVGQEKSAKQLAYLCPECGRVWGRQADLQRPAMGWQAINSLCFEHRGSTQFSCTDPGSFILHWNRGLHESILSDYMMWFELNIQLKLTANESFIDNTLIRHLGGSRLDYLPLLTKGSPVYSRRA